MGAPLRQRRWAKALKGNASLYADVRQPLKRKWSDQELRASLGPKLKSFNAGEVARLKARKLYLQIHKHSGANKARQMCADQLEKFKQPGSATAAGTDPFSFEGEAMLDSGAAEHIIGLSTLSKAQGALVLKVPEREGRQFSTASGTIEPDRKIRL